MSRVYNFSAGPAVLPEAVLKEAAAEMLDYRGTGMSVMEMSHRSKSYDDSIKAAFHAGRRISAVRHGSHEPDEEPGSRLHYHRTVGEKGP